MRCRSCQPIVRGVLGGLLALVVLAPGAREATGRGEEAVVAVVGTAADGRRFESAREGAEVAADLLGRGLRVVAYDDEGTERGLTAALKAARRAKPLAWIVASKATLHPVWREVVRRRKEPVFFLDGARPAAHGKEPKAWHLAPSPGAEAVWAADGLLAPLGARRVVVVHEDSEHGRALASSFTRSLSRFMTLAGVIEMEAGGAEALVRSLPTYEVDWAYVALTGRTSVAFVEALAAAGRPQSCLFADGNQAASLVARGPEVLEGSVFVSGPDPELHGRLGEDFVIALDEREAPLDVQAFRAFEAVRRVARARRQAGSDRAAKVLAAVRTTAADPGIFGTLRFAPHGGLEHVPFTWWRVEKGSLSLWTDALLPTPGCGPPLGFGHPPPAEVNEKRGKIGYLTYGEGETRTIEQDLLELGLSTGGEDEELDRIVRDEILHRAIRVAHRLFRREPDGTLVPGWSWGMSFTTEPPEDRPRSRTWMGVVAGDHPAAGGQVIGSGLVAIYSTFLKRTMYIERKLEPPLSAADRPLLDGTYRWGTDRTLNFRADKIRCLVDGLASAIGLTLSHEFGHLCGCDHDTEHPTSIMNVVAGAGASWEEAVWIPAHQEKVTNTLGIEAP